MYFDEQKYLIWAKFLEGTLKTKSRFHDKRKTPVPLNSLRTQTSLDPSTLISKILASQDINITRGREAFLNIDNHKLSMLVPYIKLYKVDGEKYVPFHFPNYTHMSEVQSIIEAPGNLSGAGIRNFEIKFQGKDTFTAEKIIDCNLTFFVQNMNSFFEVTHPGHAPLAELITIKKSATTYQMAMAGIPEELASQTSMITKGLEIKVDFGWAFYPEMSFHFTDEERLAIEESRMSLRLTLTNHSFSFSQEGLVEVQAQYIGRLEAAFDNKTADIFLKYREGKDGVVNYFKDINEKLEEINKRYAPDAEAELEASQKEKRDKEKQEVQTAGLVSAYSAILDKLDQDIKTSAIYSLVVSRELEQNYYAKVSKKTADQIDNAWSGEQAAQNEPLSAEEQNATAASSLVDLKERTIHYVYLADLVESVLIILAENYKEFEDKDIQIQLETFRMILGVTKIRTNSEQHQDLIVPIGEIPISIRQYSEWFRDNIIRLSKHRFGFKSFIETMIRDLMEASLKKMTFNNAPIFATNVKFGTIVLTSNKKHASLEGKTMIDAEELPPFLHGIEVDRYDTDVDYILFYSYEEGLQKQTTKDGSQTKDLEDGVHHFFLGKDRGLIKEISFSKVDIPFRKEALIEQSYSLFEELRMPYNATIKMFGNNLFRPGSQIYINPSTIGMGDPRNPESPAVKLGLGGYYSVTSVSTSMSESGVETTLDAVFTGWPSNESIAAYLPVGEGTGSEALLKEIARQGEAAHKLEAVT